LSTLTPSQTETAPLLVRWPWRRVTILGRLYSRAGGGVALVERELQVSHASHFIRIRASSAEPRGMHTPSSVEVQEGTSMALPLPATANRRLSRLPWGFNGLQWHHPPDAVVNGDSVTRVPSCAVVCSIDAGQHSLVCGESGIAAQDSLPTNEGRTRLCQPACVHLRCLHCCLASSCPVDPAALLPTLIHRWVFHANWTSTRRGT
jgi:hypothetical protein